MKIATDKPKEPPYVIDVDEPITRSMSAFTINVAHYFEIHGNRLCFFFRTNKDYPFVRVNFYNAIPADYSTTKMQLCPRLWSRLKRDNIITGQKEDNPLKVDLQLNSKHIYPEKLLVNTISQFNDAPENTFEYGKLFFDYGTIRTPALGACEVLVGEKLPETQGSDDSGLERRIIDLQNAGFNKIALADEQDYLSCYARKSNLLRGIYYAVKGCPRVPKDIICDREITKEIMGILTNDIIMAMLQYGEEGL